MTRDSLEGFLFPASYEFTQRTTARELVADQLGAFRQRFRSVDLSYARSKNLTAYDVLIIASMIEKETAVPRERRLVSAVIQPAAQPDAARHRRHDPVRPRHPGHRVVDEGGAPLRLPVQHAPPEGLRRRRSRTRARLHRAAANPARGVDYLYYVRKPNSLSHYFTASESDFSARSASTATLRLTARPARAGDTR